MGVDTSVICYIMKKTFVTFFAVWLAWDFGVLYGSSVVRDVWGSIVRRCVCVHVKYLVAELFFSLLFGIQLNYRKLINLTPISKLFFMYTNKNVAVG